MVRYMIIASDKRHNEDHRTVSEMFHSYYDEMADVSFPHALSLILDCLRNTVVEYLCLSEEEISGLIDKFVDNLSDLFKHYLSLDSFTDKKVAHVPC